jgi:hypothetical protein
VQNVQVLLLSTIIRKNSLVSAGVALENCNSETGIKEEEFEGLRSYLGFDNEDELKSYLKHSFVS